MVRAHTLVGHRDYPAGAGYCIAQNWTEVIMIALCFQVWETPLLDRRAYIDTTRSLRTRLLMIFSPSFKVCVSCPRTILFDGRSHCKWAELCRYRNYRSLCVSCWFLSSHWFLHCWSWLIYLLALALCWLICTASYTLHTCGSDSIWLTDWDWLPIDFHF